MIHFSRRWVYLCAAILSALVRSENLVETYLHNEQSFGECDHSSELYYNQSVDLGFDNPVLLGLEEQYTSLGCFDLFGGTLAEMAEEEIFQYALNQIQKDLITVKDICDGGGGYGKGFRGDSIMDLLGGHDLKKLFGICRKGFEKCYHRQVEGFFDCIHSNYNLEKCQCHFAYSLEKRCQDKCYKHKKSKRLAAAKLFDRLYEELCSDCDDDDKHHNNDHYDHYDGDDCDSFW